MKSIHTNPTLYDFQQYVSAMERERGFSEYDVLQQCLLLVEEVGELAKSLRENHSTVTLANDAPLQSVEHEIADVFIMLCAIANRTHVDIEGAFRKKEVINNKRSWR